jgi:hypothetical protein
MLFYVERWRSPGLTKYSRRTNSDSICGGPEHVVSLHKIGSRLRLSRLGAVGEGVKFYQKAGYGKSACPVRAGNDPKLKIADDRDGT